MKTRMAANASIEAEATAAPAAVLLRSPRVLVSEWRSADALSYLALDLQSASTGARLDDQARSVDQALAAIAYFQALYRRGNGLGTWMVRARADDRFIGAVSLMPVADEVEFGGRFMAHAWGRMLGVHVGRLIIAYGFSTCGLAQISTHHHPGNRAATAVVVRLGFADVGDAIHLGQRARRFVLTRERWQQRCRRP